METEKKDEEDYPVMSKGIKGGFENIDKEVVEKINENIDKLEEIYNFSYNEENSENK